VPGFDCVGSACKIHEAEASIDFDTTLSGNITVGSIVIPTLLKAGDDTANKKGCAFVSFKVSGIPKGSIVSSATLTIEQINVVGAPYTDLGQLQAQKVKYTVLDTAALNLAQSSSVAISTSASTGTKTANVTTMVAEDVKAGAANSQFRLCFATASDNDSVQDFVQIASANGKPVLSLKYHP